MHGLKYSESNQAVFSANYYGGDGYEYPCDEAHYHAIGPSIRLLFNKDKQLVDYIFYDRSSQKLEYHEVANCTPTGMSYSQTLDRLDKDFLIAKKVKEKLYPQAVASRAPANQANQTPKPKPTPTPVNTSRVGR